MRLVEQRLHHFVEGRLRRVQDADPVLQRVDRVRHQLLEGGVVRIRIRANDFLERLLADPDVETVDAGPIPAVKMSASG